MPDEPGGARDYERALQALRTDDYKTALPLLERCAAAGNARAQYDLLILYREGGHGIRKNPARRAYWVEQIIKLADSGDPVAQRLLGEAHLISDQFTQDINLARHWLIQAAENGDAEAQYALFGFMLDEDRERHWLLKAVEQEHPEALWHYSREFFVDDKPTEKAIDLITRAAKAGLQPAIEYLARLKH